MKILDSRSLTRATEKLKANPQVWLTIFVAVAIFASFLFTATQFAKIARDAQDRLVNVRVGSLQDAFAPLAALFIDDTPRLRSYMEGLTERNPTIVEFEIVRNTSNGWVIVTSLADERIGTNLAGDDFVLSLAVSDPNNSFTVEEVQSGERFFRTVRAITGPDETVLGVVMTRQTLSEADSQIAGSIKTSIFILVGILLFLLLLFFLSLLLFLFLFFSFFFILFFSRKVGNQLKNYLVRNQPITKLR